MSVKIMARVWGQSTMNDGKLLVLLALADFANDQGECWPSIPMLAAKARLTDRQTRRVLDELEAAGEIGRNRSNGGRNQRTRYRILLPENPVKITLKKLQGKNNPVIGDTQNPDIGDRKTLVPVSGAINRHRTVIYKNRQYSGDGRFDQFWNAWPKYKRKSKGTAQKAWNKIRPDDALFQKILGKLEQLKKSIGWTKDNGQFIPYPATWLNAEGWEDEVDDFLGMHRKMLD